MPPVTRSLAVILPCAALLCACGGATEVPPLAAGSTWIVSENAEANGLTIPAGVTIGEPEGKDVTMTVGGIGMPIAPGDYQGKVQFSVTEEIPVQYRDLEPHKFKAALYVNDGKVDEGRSVRAALAGGRVSDTQALNLIINSKEERFNGIYVTGNSKYTINNATIDFTGNGGNDFAGYGAAIMATGNADLTVENAKITTRGAVRVAFFAGGHATLRVNNSTVDVYNGTLPADYQWNVDLGKMMEVPWMLGLSGNVRATNAVENATVYFTNSHIRTQGWGALSVDDTAKVRLYVTNSTIENTESGYGAYSIGDSIDTFSGSTINAVDYGVIVGAEGGAVFTDGTTVNSGRIGVMFHTGVGGGKVIVDKGSTINAKETVFQAKGRGTTIEVDGARLISGNGIILQAMPNDDPFMAGGGFGGPPGGGPPGGMGPPPGSGMGPPPGGGMGPPPGGSAAGVGVDALDAALSPDVVAGFKNVNLEGDLINARTSQGDLVVTLASSTLKGAVSSGSAAPASGKAPTQETYREIGDVKNTLAHSTHAKNGAQLNLDGKSTWTVDKTSYLTRLTLAEGTKLQAADGKRLALIVNGANRPIAAGTYSGRIEVRVGGG